jgi:hypothetical protein
MESLTVTGTMTRSTSTCNGLGLSEVDASSAGGGSDTGVISFPRFRERFCPKAADCTKQISKTADVNMPRERDPIRRDSTTLVFMIVDEGQSQPRAAMTIIYERTVLSIPVRME